jgi:DNA-binding MarR family transcriptional regulator
MTAPPTDAVRKGEGELLAARAPEPAGSPSSRNGEVNLGPLADFVGFHLRLAQDASFRAFASHCGRQRLRPGHFAAMMVIDANPGITQIALSRAIARDKSTVTPLIQELGRRALVARRPSAVDRRSITLTLTAAGKAMLADLLVHAEEHDARLDAIVGERKAELIGLLKKIADGLS